MRKGYFNNSTLKSGTKFSIALDDALYEEWNVKLDQIMSIDPNLRSLTAYNLADDYIRNLTEFEIEQINLIYYASKE